MMDTSILTRLLRHTWDQALDRLGGKDPKGTIFEGLIDLYKAPNRYYHGVNHLTSCVTLAQIVARNHMRFEEIVMALFFHDAYQNLLKEEKSDEEISAEYARRLLINCGVSRNSLDIIKSCILTTQDHTCGKPGSAESWVSDIDMSILGENTNGFEVYEWGIRQEFLHVADDDYNLGRGKFLTQLLAQDKIFCNPFMQIWLEDRARENIERLIARLCSDTVLETLP